MRQKQEGILCMRLVTAQYFKVEQGYRTHLFYCVT